MPNSPHHMMQMSNSPQQFIHIPNPSQPIMQNPKSQQYAHNQGGFLNSSSQPTWSQGQSPLNAAMPDGKLQNRQTFACRADLMTVDQTAAWVRTLGYVNGWGEAEEYENNFRSNKIKGYLLQSLTLKSLKMELGISKWGHRMEIIRAIKKVFPDMWWNSVRNSPVLSPLVQSSVGNESVGPPINTVWSPKVSGVSPTNVTPQMPSRTGFTSNAANKWKGNGVHSGVMGYPVTPQNGLKNVTISNQATSQNGPQPGGMGFPGNVGSNLECNATPHVGMGYTTIVGGNANGMKNNSRIGCHLQGMKTFLNARNRNGDSLPEAEKIGENHRSIVRTSKTATERNEVPFSSYARGQDMEKVHIDGKKKTSRRAAPTNPVKYKALCSVDIRSAKSGKGHVVGELKEGQIVVLNQIKGRNGRIVERKKNGVYKKVGWVPLRTGDGVRLLENLEANIKDERSDHGETQRVKGATE